jgi:polyisoprenyl-phosphate glycosyltransferase
MQSAPPLKLVLLMPVYDDWQSARLLIGKVDAALSGIAAGVKIILVDDGSLKPPPAPLIDLGLKNVLTVERLRLRRNLGHQRAIAIGLCFVHQERDCDAVLVMDADGEDKAEDVPKLIQRHIELHGTSVVFAERTRRSESAIFRFFYQSYRVLHRMLTGIPVKVGNFSIISREHLAALSVVSDLWNHYAASVYKARLPVAMLPTTRGSRLAGQSRLNFVNLVIHGLSAISVFAETVGVRLMLGIGVLMLLSLGLVGLVVAVRLGTALAIPGWATSAVGLLLILVLQMLTLVAGLTFSVLFNRNNLTFLPARDYRYFVGEISTLHGQPR